MPIRATDAFRPDQWREFFQTVGKGAAARTGLIFVAMSLNVGAITANTAHRYRAAGSLIGLASVFMLSALALMGGQHHQAIAWRYSLCQAYRQSSSSGAISGPECFAVKS